MDSPSSPSSPPSVLKEIWTAVKNVLLPDGKTKTSRLLQTSQVAILAALAFSGIALQVFTETDNNDELENTKVEIAITVNAYAVFHCLLEELNAFLTTINDKYEDFLQKAEQAMRHTDSTLIWIEQWFRPEDLSEIDRTKVGIIETPTSLSLALRAFRNHRKSGNGTSELEMINFYYDIFSDIFKALSQISVGLAGHFGWSETRAHRHIHQFELEGEITYQIVRLIVEQKRNVSIQDALYRRLLIAVISYEEFLSSALTDSAISRELLTTNFTKLETVMHFGTLYGRVINLDYNNEPQLSLIDLTDTWHRVQAATDWVADYIEPGATTLVIEHANQWKQEDVVSVILLSIAMIIAFADIFAHLAAVLSLQSNSNEITAQAEEITVVNRCIYDHIPQGAIELFAAAGKRQISIAENRPQLMTDVCVAIIDVPSIDALTNGLINNPNKLGAARYSELLEQYYITLEDVLRKRRCLNFCKIEMFGHYCCLASGFAIRQQQQLQGDHVAEMLSALLELQGRCEAEILVNTNNDDEGAEKSKEMSQLHVRIGLHVGPAVCYMSQLRGLPRTTIYGEVMDLASLAHATSLPLKIQATNAVVDRYNGGCCEFRFFERAVIHQKNRGDIGLYWVVWNDDNDDDDDNDGSNGRGYQDDDDSSSVIGSKMSSSRLI